MNHDAYDAFLHFKRYARTVDKEYKRHKRHGYGLEAVIGQAARPLGAVLDLVCSFEGGATE